MRKYLVATVVFLCLLTLGPSQSRGQSQDEVPPPEVVLGTPIFVSTFGGQILSIDSETGTTLATYTGDDDFYPEDIVVGPDGMVYVCDTQGDRIFRMDQDLVSAEEVYTFGEGGGPQGPEGPSFGPGDDLYFNTRDPNHSGIWRIPGIASVPFDASSFPAPVNVFDADDTGSEFGEGTAWTLDGRLLVVDRTLQRILVSDSGFTSLTDLTGDLNTDPYGVAVNSSGDIFVAFLDTGNIEWFSPAGASQGIWASFGTAEGPYFIEFDASDTLYVTTSGSGGMLQKVDPSGFPISTVASGLGTAVGVAVPATSASEEQEFTSEDNSQDYDFGDHTLVITTDVEGSCDVTVIATETPPEDVADRMEEYFPDAECVRYGGHGGNCIVYSIFPYPVPDCFDGDYIELVTKYYSEAESNPAFLHDPSGDDSDDFTEDILVSYYPDGLPGGDPAKRGRTDTFQEFVSVDLGFGEDREGYFLGFERPLKSNGSARFKSGRTIPVKFSAMDQSGKPIRDAVARLAVARVEPDFQIMPVLPAGKSNVGTLFRSSGKKGKYVYNLKTTGYARGIYSITVSSDSFPPQTVRFTIR